MLGKETRTTSVLSQEPAIVLGTLGSVSKLVPERLSSLLVGDGYWMGETERGNTPCYLITAKTDRGVLYGVFAFLNRIAREKPSPSLPKMSNPANSIRMIDRPSTMSTRVPCCSIIHSCRNFAESGTRFDRGAYV